MTPNDPDFAAVPAPDSAPEGEPAPKPRRRRAPKAVATDVAAADSDVGEAVAAEPPAAPPRPPAVAEPPANVGSAQDAGPNAERNDDGEGPRSAQSEEGSDAAGEGPAAEGPAGDGRRRRRNRRRGRRGADRLDSGAPGAPADESPMAGADAAQPEAVEVPSLPPTDVNELFAEVVSGAYDSTIDHVPVADPVVQEPVKRVLAADPDAPKLHKVLAQSGVGSRRDLEQMITEGRVSVNGQPAHIGQRISFGDRISIDDKPVRVRIAPPPPRVIAYHKPVGEVVTHDDPQQRPTVFRRLPRLQQGKWQSVGRLDINTEGLLLFTNSGDLANRLMHPRFGVEREYAVRVLGTLTEDERSKLLEGIEIEGQPAAFQSIADGGGEGVNHWYRVVITEGRNREVRKLMESVGKAVSRLIRIRYGSVVLPRGLKRGVWVDLSNDDVKALRLATGMPRRDGPGPGPGPGPGTGAAGGAPQDDKRGRRGGRRGRGGRRDGEERVPQGVETERAGDFDDDVEREHVGPIPNPLQQTYDRRAIQQARKQREYSEDGPIPNPLQQTYDKRAVQGERKTRPIDEDGPIPNPLQQTYDKRFANTNGPRSGGGGGGGAGGGQRGRRKPGSGQRAGGGTGAGGQPDPMRTSVGYIGADAFHNKGRGGRGGKGGGRGGGGKGGPRR